MGETVAAAYVTRWSRWWCGSVLLLLGCAGCQLSSTGYNIDGVRKYQQGQPQAALEMFQQAIAADPRDSEGYYNTAATYHYLAKQANDRQMLDQAESIYHQCLDLNPDHVDCHRALAVLLVESGRSDKAFTLLERWVERRPQLADARIELARLYDEYGDRTLAERYLTEALQLDAQNSRAWSALAALRERKGDMVQALSNYQRSLQLDGRQPLVADRVAQLQQRLGHTATDAAPGPLTARPRLASQPRPLAR